MHRSEEEAQHCHPRAEGPVFRKKQRRHAAVRASTRKRRIGSVRPGGAEHADLAVGHMGRLKLMPFLKRCLSATAVHGMKRRLGIVETKAYQRAAVWTIWTLDGYSMTCAPPTV